MHFNNPLFLVIKTTDRVIIDDWCLHPKCSKIACIAYKIGKITHIAYNIENTTSAMTKKQVLSIIGDIVRCTKMHTLVTFKGSIFDIKLLAEYAKVENSGIPDLYDEVIHMNHNKHIDICRTSVAPPSYKFGSQLTIQNVCYTMNIGSNSYSNVGLDAVVLWNLGGDAFKRVIEYTKQDVYLLSLLYRRLYNETPSVIEFTEDNKKIHVEVELKTVIEVMK